MTENNKWVCVWERLCLSMGMVMVHDGQRNPGQFEFAPEDVRFYTRTYRAMVDGEFVNTWVKFIYDEREGEVDMEVSLHDPTIKKGKAKERMKMSQEVSA